MVLGLGLIIISSDSLECYIWLLCICTLSMFYKTPLTHDLNLQIGLNLLAQVYGGKMQTLNEHGPYNGRSSRQVSCIRVLWVTVSASYCKLASGSEDEVVKTKFVSEAEETDNPSSGLHIASVKLKQSDSASLQ